MNKVTFVVFSDLHLDIPPTALDYFRIFIEEISGREFDFVVQLGDLYVFRPWIEEYFKNPGAFEMREEYEPGFEYYKEYYLRFLKVKKALPGLYSVLGNHDHDRADKGYLCRQLGMPAAYYSVECRGFDYNP